MSDAEERLTPYSDFILTTIDELIARDPRPLTKAEKDDLRLEVLRTGLPEICDGLSAIPPDASDHMQSFLRDCLTNAYPERSTQPVSAPQIVPPRVSTKPCTRDRRKGLPKTFGECPREDETTDPVVSWWVAAPRETWQTTYENEAVARWERTPDRVRRSSGEIPVTPAEMEHQLSVVETPEGRLRRSVDALPDHTFRHRRRKKKARTELPNLLARLGAEPISPSVPIILGGESIGAVDVDAIRRSAATLLASAPGSELEIKVAARRIAEAVRRGTIDKMILELVEDQRFYLEQATQSEIDKGIQISHLIAWLEGQTDLGILQTDRGLITLRLVLTEPANPAVQRRALKWLVTQARHGHRPRRPKKQTGREETEARRLTDTLAVAIRRARQDRARQNAQGSELTPQDWKALIRERVVRTCLPDWSADDHDRAVTIACETGETAPRPIELAAKITQIQYPTITFRRLRRGR